MPYYAVSKGRTTGIFLTWAECQEKVKGYSGAIYKKFDTKEEAEGFIRGTSGEGHKETIDVDYYVYTDGACSNNGKEGACAGIGVYFGEGDPRNISRRVEGKQTNNVAELMAILAVYDIIKDDIVNGKKIGIVSDSEYAIKCVSSYGDKCNKQNWNVDIPNKELVKTVYQMYTDKPNIGFIHIKAHTNHTDIHSVGNDHADKLANIAIGLETCPYNHPTIHKKYI